MTDHNNSFGRSHRQGYMNHSRSASWSFSNTNQSNLNSNNSSELSSGIATLRSMFIDLVNPSFSPTLSVPTSNNGNQRSTASSLASDRPNDIDSALTERHPDNRLSNSVPDGTTSIEEDATNVNHSSANNSGNGRGEFNAVAKWLEKHVPFFLLILVRFIWDHRLGLFVFLGLCVTFVHGNNTVRRQVALKERRQFRILLWMIIFLLGNVLFIYYVFHEQQLYRCLYLMAANFKECTIWNVFWIVGITDYVIRFITMMLKCLIAALCKRVIAFKMRGKYYMFLEHLSQLYRMLIPIPLWSRYFSENDDVGHVFSLASVAIYFAIKGVMTFSKLREVYQSYLGLWQDLQYGTTPTKEELIESGSICPICQEEIKEPIKLDCKHIFCDDCISLWFDRERSCPLCRARIARGPMWRDGSTSAFVQIF